VSFQFMPLYVGDYLKDTRHLSCSEHGIYLNFIMHCWSQRAPLPKDERKLVGICNARSGDEIEAMRRVLNEFFIEMSDGLYNKRISEEIARAEVLSKANSEAGKKSAAIRARSQVRRNSSTSVERALNERLTSVGTPTSTSTTTTTTTKDQKSLATSSPKQTSNSNSKKRFVREAAGIPSAWRTYCQEKRPRLNPDEVYEEFSDYWVANAKPDAMKLDWDAAFRTWVRKVFKTSQELADEQQREKQKYML
jgi:uncharacterized protein YdaU (DUF1376 family)